MLNGHCSECDVTSIICRCSQYYTAPVRTSCKGRPCGKRAFVSYTMATLSTLYDTPRCPPADDGSTDSQLNTAHEASPQTPTGGRRTCHNIMGRRAGPRACGQAGPGRRRVSALEKNPGRDASRTLNCQLLSPGPRLIDCPARARAARAAWVF